MAKDYFQLLRTADGSWTVRHPGFTETYHSVHGARTESVHVFIRNGLQYLLERSRKTSIDLLEMGLGTGLNAMLTYEHARGKGIEIRYKAVEKFPLANGEILLEGLPEHEAQILSRIHQCPWNKPCVLDTFFQLHKIRADFRDFDLPAGSLDLIYYDAFSPGSQPELWTPELFGRMFAWLRPGGVWVTYVAKGQVRRDLQAAGFAVERLPGPPGKREILRAVKPEGV